MSEPPDTAADYRTLLEDGIVVWPVEKAQFWADYGDRPAGPLDEWTRDLVAWAESDGLCAAQLWFHHWTGADLFTWPCVQLLRPDGSKYPSARAESWDGFPGVPRVEREAAMLRPLVEENWGETLTAARERAQSSGEH